MNRSGGTRGAAPARDRSARQARRRVVALDWARGMMILLNLSVVAALPPRSDQLRHADWLGVTLFDIVFPLFVALSGCGLAFAYARGVSWRVLIRRSVVLMACGLLYGAVMDRSFALDELRIFGPLQLYAFLTAIVGIMHLVVRSLRAWVVVTLVMAVVWTVLFWAAQAGCPTGGPTRECNLSADVDLTLIPVQHLYHGGASGHDPEGIIAMVGALLTMLVGVVAGRMVLTLREPRRLLRALVTWAALILVLGLLAMIVVDPFKRLWSPSFALVTGAVAIGMLALGYLIFDAPIPGWWARRRDTVAQPFIALGRNALILYFGSHVAFSFIVGSDSLVEFLLGIGYPWGHQGFTFLVQFVLAWWVVAMMLHRRGIYVRA